MTVPDPHPPLELVVPFPLGHPSDFAARCIAPGFAELLHRPVTVENSISPTWSWRR